MMKIAGGCLCGSIRYESAAAPLMVAACHCSTCQKNTGSAFSLNLAMPADAVAIHGDTLKIYEEHSDGDAEPFYRAFCSVCGSPISGQGVAYPGVLFLKAGTLDDASEVKPDLHIWSIEKQPWVVLDAGKVLPRGLE